MPGMSTVDDARERAPAAEASRPDGRRRLVAADVLRAVAALAVIGTHVLAWTPSRAPWTEIQQLTRFALPVFVIVSGLLLQHRYAHTARGMGFLRHRFSRTLVPWIAWAPVGFLLGLTATGQVSRAGGAGNWWEYGAGHLWFLLLIPQMYLVFTIWPRRHLWRWAGLALLIQTGLQVQRLAWPMVAHSLAAVPTLWFGFLLFPYWIGYFGVGIAASRWLPGDGRAFPRRLIGGAIMVAGGAVLALWAPLSSAANGQFDQGTGAFLDPALAPLVLGVLIVAASAGERALTPFPALAGLVRRLSGWSLGIYIVHPLVLNTVTAALLGSELGSGDPWVVASSALAGFAVTLAVSAALVRLIEATPAAPTVGLSRRTLPPGPGGYPHHPPAGQHARH